jgi:hypothetical protein
MSTIRTKLVTAAAVVAAAAGGAGIASAASSGTSTTASRGATARHTVDGKTEQALSGTTAQRVHEAALAKVDGTVVRVETNVDGSARGGP